MWAIGVLLFRTAAGRPPLDLDGLPTFEALRRVADRPPPPIRSVAPKVPRDLATVIDRCLAFDPGDRYPDAAAVRDELDRVRSGVAPQARPVSAVGRAVRAARRHPVPAALLLVIVLGSLASTAVMARLVGIADAQRALAAESEQTVQRVADELLFDVADLLEGEPGTLAARIRLLEIGLAYADDVAPPDAELAPDRALDLAEALVRLGYSHGRRRPAPDPERSELELPPGAIAAVRRGVELCRLAAEAAPDDADVLGRAAVIVRRAAWSGMIHGEDKRRLYDDLLPSLIERTLALDPDQLDALAARVWLTLNRANRDRLEARRLEAIEQLESIVPDLERLVAARPEDPETAELAAIITGALLQHRLWANDAGVVPADEPLAVLPVAEAHVHAADRAARVVGTTQAIIRRSTARNLLGLALVRDAPGRETEAVELVASSISRVEGIAASEPSDWWLRRLVSVAHYVASVTRAELAYHHEAGDPDRRRAHLLAARDHLTRLTDVLAVRAAAGELVINDDSMVGMARERLAHIDAALGGTRLPGDDPTRHLSDGVRSPEP